MNTLDRPVVRGVLVTALTVLVLSTVATMVLTATRHPTYTAHAELVLGPPSSVTTDTVPTYLDALSTGGPAETAALMLTAAPAEDAAAATTGRAATAFTIASTVDPVTNVITLTVTGSTATEVEQVAQALVDRAMKTSTPSNDDFVLTLIGAPAGSAKANATDTAPVLGAEIVGLLVAAGALVAPRLRRSRRSVRGAIYLR